jgi:antirestriction protein
MQSQTQIPSRETGGPPNGARAAVFAASRAKTNPQHLQETANPSGDRPAIYVACLAAYNNGHLHGAWIWADDADDMRADTRAMLARSPEPDAEEWAIHDFAGFEGARVEEYQSFETVAALAAFIHERGALGAKVLEYYGHDLEDARKAFEEYCGEFESVADYAAELTADCGPEIPKTLRHYIDYASMGCDMEINGDVFTVEMGHNVVHVFRRH